MGERVRTMASIIKRGDIWLVDLDPTRGHEINKRRPAVIVQNDIGNAYSSTTIVAPITSQNTEQLYPFEVVISTKLTGLNCRSKILLDQIRTVDKSRLVKRLGTLDSTSRIQTDEALRYSLGLQ